MSFQWEKSERLGDTTILRPLMIIWNLSVDSSVFFGKTGIQELQQLTPLQQHCFSLISSSKVCPFPVKVYHLYDTGNWTYSYRLFYDATVPYFGSRHLPYAITAVLVFMLMTILPMLLLSLYPFRCFQKFLNLLSVCWYILHTFVDSLCKLQRWDTARDS